MNALLMAVNGLASVPAANTVSVTFSVGAVPVVEVDAPPPPQAMRAAQSSATNAGATMRCDMSATPQGLSVLRGSPALTLGQTVPSPTPLLLGRGERLLPLAQH